MTFKERLEMEHPEYINYSCGGGCWGCPYEYGYEEPRDCSLDCTECWNREIPEENKEERDMNKKIDKSKLIPGTVIKVTELWQAEMLDEVLSKYNNTPSYYFKNFVGLYNDYQNSICFCIENENMNYYYSRESYFLEHSEKYGDVIPFEELLIDEDKEERSVISDFAKWCYVNAICFDFMGTAEKSGKDRYEEIIDRYYTEKGVSGQTVVVNDKEYIVKEVQNNGDKLVLEVK